MEQKNPHEIFGQPNTFLLKTLLCLPQKSIASRNSLTRDTLSCSVILFYGSQVLFSPPQRSIPNRTLVSDIQHHGLNEQESQQTLGDSGGHRSLARYSP